MFSIVLTHSKRVCYHVKKEGITMITIDDKDRVNACKKELDVILKDIVSIQRRQGMMTKDQWAEYFDRLIEYGLILTKDHSSIVSFADDVYGKKDDKRTKVSLKRLALPFARFPVELYKAATVYKTASECIMDVKKNKPGYINEMIDAAVENIASTYTIPENVENRNMISNNVSAAMFAGVTSRSEIKELYENIDTPTSDDFMYIDDIKYIISERSGHRLQSSKEM